MVVSKDYSSVRVGARKVKESLPGRVLVEVKCFSSGHHGRGGNPEISAGDPLTRGHASWSIMDVDEEYDLPELKELVGKPVQIWTGDGWGSYHERSITVFLIAPGLSGFKKEAKDIKLVSEFPFHSLRASCEELINKLGIGNPPYSQDFPKLDVPESHMDWFSDEDADEALRRLSIETPDKPKLGETSQQYWDRLRDEKIGKHHYKHEGD